MPQSYEKENVKKKRSKTHKKTKIMEKYNYFEAVCADVREWINEHAEGVKVTAENRDELAEKWQDEMWTADSVTGNGSGSYTLNTWQAEENICHNLDLLREACDEFVCDVREYLESAETADVTIRCYLLPQAIAQVLDELETDEDEDEDEEND